MKKITKIIMLVLTIMVLLSSCGSTKKNDVEEKTKKEEKADKDKKDKKSDKKDKEDKKEDKKKDKEDKEDKKDEKDKKEDKEDKKDKEDKGSDDDSNDDLPAAVDFTLKDKDGNEVSLSDYKGKVIILNFFTTWCKYCIQEMPEFQEVSQEYSDDVVFLLVDVFQAENISEDEVFNWYEEKGYTMPMVVDSEGSLQQTYPVTGFPTSYVINRDFNVLGSLPGAVDKATLTSIIEDYK